jgi:hypothetical protein
MMRALLIGTAPDADLGFAYTAEAPFDAVVIGSLTLGQLLCFQNERVLEAIALGKPVYLYVPGMPRCPHNRAMAASIAAAQRELKNWGVLFTDGARRHLITAQEAKDMRSRGQRPPAGAVMTPLAKEILEGIT